MTNIDTVEILETSCLATDATLFAPNITLSGILGRGLVLHEREDDHGKGGTVASRTTGSAGARIACGTITGV